MLVKYFSTGGMNINENTTGQQLSFKHVVELNVIPLSVLFGQKL